MVSVSCVGSNGLKLLNEDLWDAMSECFSILCRIEWVETGGKGKWHLPTDAFQYPVSDRMG